MPEVGRESHIKDIEKAKQWGIHFHYYLIINGSLMTPFIFIGIAGLYYILYHFEFSFIEQYKANTMPWPWYEMG